MARAKTRDSGKSKDGENSDGSDRKSKSNMSRKNSSRIKNTSSAMCSTVSGKQRSGTDLSRHSGDRGAKRRISISQESSEILNADTQ